MKDADKRKELYQEAVWACAQVIKKEDNKLVTKENGGFEKVWRDLCADKTNYTESEFIWALPFLNGARGQVLALTGLKMSERVPDISSIPSRMATATKRIPRPNP